MIPVAMVVRLAAAVALLLVGSPVPAQVARARDLGIRLPGATGPYNAITDVAGVEVGHATIIHGEGPAGPIGAVAGPPGSGPARTGVTAILPRGRSGPDSVFAAVAWLNANGEMTGALWVDDGGVLESPILITNTNSLKCSTR